MKIQVILICILASTMQCELFCEKLLSNHEYEESLVEELKNNISSYSDDLGCIEIFLRRGLHNALDIYLGELGRREVKFRETMKIAINKIQRRNEELHNKFRFDASEFQIVSPAYMWAQSLNNIYIHIKFGHRHDSPGCLEIKNEEVKISNQTLQFQGYCVQGDIPIKFELNLNFFREVLADNAVSSTGSVGRLTITLPKKNAPEYWRSIAREGDSQGNVKVWMEMMDKYEEELQPFKEKEEAEEEETNRKKGRRKRKGKRKSDL